MEPPPTEVQTRRHYNKEHKELVIYQKEKLGKTTKQIALDLDMSVRVVQRVLQLWEEIGRVSKDPRAYAKQGRAVLLDTKCTDFMLALLDRDPDLYLDELADRLMEQHSISVSLSTIQRTLKLLGITSKKLSKVAAERCEETRQKFIFDISSEAPWRLVFCDESSVNLHTTYRTMGRALKGKRAIKKAYFQRGDRYSVLPALSLDGYIYSDIVPGSFNGPIFMNFLRGLLEEMNPYPAAKSVLVMDNCAIHHIDGVRELCDERGVKLMYLPPYSPDLNPIEQSFSFMKAYISRHGVRFRADIASKDPDKPYHFLNEALGKVTPDLAKSWFRGSGYF